MGQKALGGRTVWEHGRTCDVAFSKPIAACARRELCGHAARARALHKANARTARRQCVTV